MNSRDRVFLALACKEADRVPIGELVIEQTIIEKFNRIYGTAYQDCVDFALGQGVDLVGDRADFGKVETLSDGTYKDKWGCLYKPYSAHPLKGPIENDDSLNAYTFPDPDDPALLGRLETFVKKAGKQIAINFHGRVAFMWSVYLMGMDNLLMAMALKPDFVHELFSKVADVNIRLIQNAISAGADTVSLGDDYCANKGPLMSPEMFRTFIFPQLKKAVDAIHAAGAKCIKHCDGNTWPILQDMIDAGIDCINPLEPVAGMEIAEVKRKFGNRVCIMGNIDCAELLCHGSVQEVDDAVKQCIKDGAAGGGLIVCSSNSIHEGVNPCNYKAMIDAVGRYGCYPISA